MTSDKKDDVEKVDLTDPGAVEQVSDEDLDKVAGGFSRTTLSTSIKPTSTLSPDLNTTGVIAETVYGGLGDELLNFGGTFDTLKR